LYRELLEWGIILDMFCKQLTVDEWKNWALWHPSYPKDFKARPRTGLPSWKRKQEMAGRPICL
jgi:hypothetical protein